MSVLIDHEYSLSWFSKSPEGLRNAHQIGQGHGALAGFLKDRQADTLICGGIGGPAQETLKNAGIRLYGGVSGSADEAALALLSGTLSYDPDVQCGCHGHHAV